LLDRLPAVRRRHARLPRMDGGQVEPGASGAITVDPMPSPDSPLIARFRATAPVPVTSTEHQVYDRLLHLLRIIERALRALKSFASALTKHEDDRQRRMMAKLDTDSALDSSRAHRAAADAALKRWEAEHPWQMMRAKAFEGEGGFDITFASRSYLRAGKPPPQCRLGRPQLSLQSPHLVHSSSVEQVAVNLSRS
jgi:hypothetical protein